MPIPLTGLTPVPLAARAFCALKNHDGRTCYTNAWITISRALWKAIRSNTRVLAAGIARNRKINLDIDDTSRPLIARYESSYPIQRCGTIRFDEEKNEIEWQVGEDSHRFSCVGDSLVGDGETFSLHDFSREFLGQLFGIVASR